MKLANTKIENLNDEVVFDGLTIKKIKFDLDHINYGWNPETGDYHPPGVIRNTNITADEVIDFFEQYEFYQPEWELDQNKEEVIVRDVLCHRYTGVVIDYDNGNKEMKIIIDIPVDFKNEAVVVTIY